MTKIILENIRSFDGKHSIELKPLTLLVGENSSGKSTFLAAASCVLTSDSIPSPKGLNSSPYDLGGYDSVATYKGGKAGRKKTFSLGLEGKRSDERSYSYCATYHRLNGRSVVKQFCLTSNIGKVELEFTFDSVKGKISGLPNMGDVEFNETVNVEEISSPVLHNIFLKAITGRMGKDLKGPPNRWMEIFELASLDATYHESGCSIAPIRTKPKRTYDGVSEEYEPEGNHIPYMLAKQKLERATSESTIKLTRALNAFGVESGLFTELSARKLGARSRDGGPFQLQVTLEGPPRNITDVGYGVSQSLPIIAQLSGATNEKYFFIQQPEVHLHPRAQAALGTFFATLVDSRQRHYLIETHSDYLIDRVRQEIAAGRLLYSDVRVLYFDIKKQKTSVHPIDLDKMGNLVDTPQSYRSFFMEERTRQLNRGS